jgi:hypothetical protein
MLSSGNLLIVSVESHVVVNFEIKLLIFWQLLC